MDPERRNHVDKLLQSALDVPPAERDVYLRSACGGDTELEHEVRSLLSAHDRADAFLAAPAIDLAARAVRHRDGDGQVGPAVRNTNRATSISRCPIAAFLLQETAAV